MADNLSNYLENKLLDHIVGKTSFVMPAVYLALFTVAPTDAGGGTEVTGGAYARKATLGTDWNAAANGLIDNAVDLTFPTATAAWGTVVAVGALDAAAAGNLLWYGALTANKTVDNGDTFKFAVGNLDLSLS